jgi:formate hydrogenlyase subunit 6/NADH:ubiquinone oxidoreductase subunit I
MKIAIFYFSGTGNTWWVSEKLKSIFIENGHDTTTYSIERKDIDWGVLIAEHISEWDIIGIGFPIYGSSIPKIMKNWVKDVLCNYSIKLSQKKRAFVYDTMAMFSGDTPLLMKKILKKGGFIVKQAINIRTLSNLPQMPRLMTWDKEKQDKIYQKAEKKIRKLVDYILINKKGVMRRDPLTRSIAAFQRFGMRWEESAFRKFFVFDSEICNLCGLCVKFCPNDNLKIEESEEKPKISFGPNCDFCMRCFNMCPQDAIFVMKRTKDTVKYRRFRDQVPGFKLSRVKN